MDEEMSPDRICRRCPVCGKLVFPEDPGYDICPDCKWEDDLSPDRDYNDADITCNDVSVYEAREAYRCGLDVMDLRKLKREGKSLKSLGLKHVRKTCWDRAESGRMIRRIMK